MVLFLGMNFNDLVHLCKMKIELWLSGWFCRPSCSSDDWWQGNTDNIKALSEMNSQNSQLIPRVFNEKNFL